MRCLGAELAATAAAQASQAAAGAGGVPPSVVLFDGLDPRGATMQTRRATCASARRRTPRHVASALGHDPIGEGDLKLAAIEASTRRTNRAPQAEQPDRCVPRACTLPSPSTPTRSPSGCRARAPRVEEPTLGPFQSALLMRERSQKRGRDGAEGQASYLVCDYDALYLLVQKDLWNVRLSVLRQMDPEQKRIAMTPTVAAGSWPAATLPRSRGCTPR